MRVNVNLEPDAYSFAAAYAKAKGVPLGAAISELLRRAEQMPALPIELSPKLRTSPRGYFVKAKTGKVITPEMVRESAEDGLV